jgi:hypothetical protein
MDSKRYYLHQKVKRFGVKIHSRKRVVEVEEKLFRFPSPLMSVYLYKISKYKYSIQSVIMLPEETKKTTEVAVVTKESLSETFKYINSKATVYEKSTAELKVEGEDQLVIAQNNASDVNALLKEADKLRKTIKEPYANAVKTIDSYVKLITDSLERSKTRLTSEITNYKVIQEAAAKKEREAKLKELETLEAEKKEETARIDRIQQQLVARIFGGSYTVKDGTSKSSAGCIKSSDCVELSKWINENAPKPDTFKHFSVLYEDMIASVKKRLTEHTTNLLDLEKANEIDSKGALEGAIRRINESRTEAAQEIVEVKQTAEKITEKSIKSEIRTINNVVAEAGKGVRDTVKWIVTDETLVPRDMLCVDEKKLNQYLNDNKEQIKNALTENTELIPGIKFFVENKFIAR